jgi:hypothetical protein
MSTETAQEVKVNPNELTTSTRKRPNKSKILKQEKLRGHLTDNEKLMLTGLTVKNFLQRLNNRCFDDLFLPSDCKKLNQLMVDFVKSSDEILNKKYVLKETKKD